MICTGTEEYPGCGQMIRLENHELKLCATCNAKRRDTDKALYPEVRRSFLEMCIRNDFVCPVMGTPITMESQIHHKRGRTGYADQWARDLDISLLIDVRYFLAVSAEGHKKIEDNPDWAKERGYSLDRLDDGKVYKSIPGRHKGLPNNTPE